MSEALIIYSVEQNEDEETPAPPKVPEDPEHQNRPSDDDLEGQLLFDF